MDWLLMIHSPRPGRLLLSVLLVLLVDSSRAWPSIPAPGPPGVVINEIGFDLPGGDLEYVELYNRSTQPVDLRQFRMADSRFEPVEVLAESRALAPHAFVVLTNDLDLFRSLFPDAGALEVSRWPALNNSGDAVVLLLGDVVIDSVAYAPSWGAPDRALERRDPDGPSTSASNWSASMAVTGGTPGAQNSVYSPDLRSPALLLAEQSSTDALTLFFDEAIDWNSIPRGGIRLGDATGLSLETTSESSAFVTFDQPLGSSELRIETACDLTGNCASGLTTLPARAILPGSIVINEILFAPRSDSSGGLPYQPEYLELFNPGSRPVSLRDAFLVVGQTRPDTIALPYLAVALAPGGFAVAYADTAKEGEAFQGSSLSRSFPDSDLANALLLPVHRSSLSLNNSGDEVRICGPLSEAGDRVAYEAAWHSPFLADPTGISLERIRPEGSSEDRTNWSSSVDSFGGTPGMPNSLHLAQQTEPPSSGISIYPSPFSPDGDGQDDITLISYDLDYETAAIRVHIFDRAGRLVRTLEEVALAGQSGSLSWDGLDDRGRILRIGMYVVLLEAVSLDPPGIARYRDVVVLARPLD